MPDVNPARVREVLEGAAAAKAGPERAAYLERACAGDVPLRAEVASLLAALDREPAFMGDPTVDRGTPVRGSSFSPTAEVDHPGADRSEAQNSADEALGATIGRYKLLERIGEGGFGVVYMAEQHHPVRRRVALKVVKPGMDSRQVLTRFEAERQALAIMDHENIAKVFDAGATDTGRPYFVMELVHGVPITEFCDKNQLPPRERLELFVQVCRAVQHAHTKGIIHRDIKPTNVLVTLHEGVPVPKVIDFGIAKATGQQLTDKTLFTNFQQMVGTPLYMSPEQAEMTGIDVDTRSDIYSLGVLLYELLTGTTPVDNQRLKLAAFDEVRRIIREEEPPRPSTRLSTMGEQARRTVAARRKSDPRRLGQLFRGELDWVVMRCLAKERDRRYDTANGLARDVQRYLADEPVDARPPSRGYRFRKFARRNKGSIVAAGALLLSLVAGIAISTWQVVRARRAETESEVRLARAHAIAGLLQEMLGSGNPVSSKGPEYTVRQLLDDFSQSLSDQLKDQPEVEASLRATLGTAYWRLGLRREAEPHLLASIEFHRRHTGGDSLELAEALVALSYCAKEQGDPRSEQYAKEALDLCNRRGGTDLMRMKASRALQVSLEMQGRLSESVAEARHALATWREDTIASKRVEAMTLHSLSETLRLCGDLAEAERVAREAVELHEGVHGGDHVETAWGLLMLARALVEAGKHQEAQAVCHKALQIFLKLHGADHHSVVQTRATLKKLGERER